MQYKIEKGIQIPASNSTGLNAVLRALKIGDSFLMEDKDRTKAFVGARCVGIKIRTTSKDQPLGEVRIWRVS